MSGTPRFVRRSCPETRPSSAASRCPTHQSRPSQLEGIASHLLGPSQFEGGAMQPSGPSQSGEGASQSPGASQPVEGACIADLLDSRCQNPNPTNRPTVCLSFASSGAPVRRHVRPPPDPGVTRRILRLGIVPFV